MFFIPNLKKKRGNSKWPVNPFPSNISNKNCKGIFTGISVEIFEDDDIITVYDSGFYGKGSQSRSAPQAVHNTCTPKVLKSDVRETLSLGLEEAFFLAYYLQILSINDTDGNQLEQEYFLQCCLSVNEFFIETLASYLYLKSKGWVVKSGLKFGGNFLIYRKGPRFFHASFVVMVKTALDADNFVLKNFKGLQRIAETSDKDVLFLEVHIPNNFKILPIKNISNLEISETIIRRFNCSSFVQNQIVTK